GPVVVVEEHPRRLCPHSYVLALVPEEPVVVDVGVLAGGRRRGVAVELVPGGVRASDVVPGLPTVRVTARTDEVATVVEEVSLDERPGAGLRAGPPAPDVVPVPRPPGVGEVVVVDVGAIGVVQPQGPLVPGPDLAVVHLHAVVAVLDTEEVGDPGGLVVMVPQLSRGPPQAEACDAHARASRAEEGDVVLPRVRRAGEQQRPL